MHNQVNNGSLQFHPIASRSLPRPICISLVNIQVQRKTKNKCDVAAIICNNVNSPYPLITCPKPSANVNGVCPVSFVDQNFSARLLFLPYPVQCTVTSWPHRGIAPVPARRTVLVKPIFIILSIVSVRSGPQYRQQHINEKGYQSMMISLSVMPKLLVLPPCSLPALYHSAAYCILLSFPFHLYLMRWHHWQLLFAQRMLHLWRR